MGQASGRCLAGEFSAQDLTGRACAQFFFFLGHITMWYPPWAETTEISGGEGRRRNMNIFANKLYFIYSKKTLKSSQGRKMVYLEPFFLLLWEYFWKYGIWDEGGHRLMAGDFEACRVFPAHPPAGALHVDGDSSGPVDFTGEAR